MLATITKSATAWVALQLLAASAAMAAAPAASSPSAGSTQPPQSQSGSELAELEEVVVHGKRLMERIVEAEDEFYKLFNGVNKDDRYDTHCVYLQAQEGSRMQSRACIPGFVADAMADWAPYKARCQPPQEMKYGRYGAEFSCLDRNNDGRLSLEEASARQELGAAFFEIDMDGDRNGDISGEEFQAAIQDRTDLSAPAIYMPPTPDAVLVNGTKKWYDHMTQVVNSDPRLHKMAAELGDLYHDLAQAQRRFDELDAEAKAKIPKRKTGPRVH